MLLMVKYIKTQFCTVKKYIYCSQFSIPSQRNQFNFFLSNYKTIVSAEIQSNNSAKSQTKPSVNESIKNAFNDEETSDMKLLVDDKIIYVHRSMLKIRLDFKGQI